MTEPLSLPRIFSMLIVENDTDYWRARITIGDGGFAGAVVVFESHDLLSRIATALSGCPSTPADYREIVIGAFGPATGGGAVKVIFRVADRAGHVALEADIEAEANAQDTPRTARVALAVEAVAIDRFVQDCRRSATEVGARLTLDAA